MISSRSAARIAVGTLLLLERGGGVHFVPEQRPDRQQRIKVCGDRLQRIERGDQDQPVELALRRRGARRRPLPMLKPTATVRVGLTSATAKS